MRLHPRLFVCSALSLLLSFAGCGDEGERGSSEVVTESPTAPPAPPRPATEATEPAVEPLREEAFALLASNRLEPALERFEVLARRDPTEPDYRVVLGNLYFAAGRLWEAAAQFERARRWEPERLDVLLGLGEFYLVLGLPDEAIAAARAAQAAAPGSAQARDILGRGAAARGEYAAAEPALRAAVAMAPGRTDVHLHLGEVLAAQGNSREALQQFEAALRTAPDSMPALHRAVRAHLQLDRPGEALELLSQVPETLAASPVWHVLEGDARRALGELAEARAAYAAAIAADPASIEARRALAELEASSGDRAAAAERYRELLATSGTDPALHESLAALYRELGRRAAADYHAAVAAELEGREPAADDLYSAALAADPDLYAAWLGRSLLRLRRGDPDAAVRDARAAARLRPDDPRALAVEAQAHVEANRNAEALPLLDRAIELQPRYGPAYRLRGEIEKSRQRAEQAVEQFQRAIWSNPVDRHAHKALADCYRRLGRNGEAEAHYRQAVAGAKGYPAAMNSLAWLYAEQARSLEEARVLALLAVSAEPVNGAYLDTLGWIRFQLGDLAEAVETLERANLQRPGQPTILFHIGAALVGLGRHAEGQAHLEAALATGEAFPEAAQARAALGQAPR